MSPAFFLTTVESGSGAFHSKSFLCGIRSQQSSLVAFQLWSGVTFGQLDILSLWPVMQMSMLKNTLAFWPKGCCLHLIVESCIVVPPFSCKMELPAILRKSQSPDINPIENLWAILVCSLRKKPTKPSSKEDLINCLRSA